MDEMWYMFLESKVFSVVERYLNEKLLAKYPNLFITSTKSVNREPSFPAVYVHEIRGYEVGQDLTNDSINAVKENIQIDVACRMGAEEDLKLVTAVATQAMKTMKFNLTRSPVYSVDDNILYSYTRFTRIVGCNDSDLVNQ